MSSTEILPELQRELDRTLSRSCMALFNRKSAGFFANLYCLLEKKWSYTMGPTACTDGISMWINPDFWLPLSEEMRITLLVHEMRHCADQHGERLKDRQPRRWNYACDHVINLEMKADGYVFDIDHLADPTYAGMGADEIYNLLPPEMELDFILPFGEDFAPPGSGEGAGEGAGDESAGDPGTAPATGSGTKPSPHRAVEILIQAATLSRMDESWGSVPGSIKTLMDDLLNPRLPWQTLLRRFFDSKSKDSFSWARPNRRYTDIYMPSRHSPTDSLSHILWGLDTSGSVSDRQLKIFNSEVSHVHNVYQPERTTILSFDTKVRDEFEFDENQTFKGLEFTGRGGTDLKDLFRRARELKPEVLIVFSDLDCEKIPKEEAPPFPVVWLCIDSKDSKVNFGKLIHFDSK